MAFAGVFENHYKIARNESIKPRFFVHEIKAKPLHSYAFAIARSSAPTHAFLFQYRPH